MDPAGLGLAVVGVAGQLFKTGIEGYKLLSTAQSFGRDYADLSHRLDTEKLRLEKWGEAWELHNSSRNIDPGHRDMRFAVATLARISAIFIELVECSSKYGMTYDNRTRKRDTLRYLLRPSSPQLPRSRSPHRPGGTGSTQTGLSRSAIERLTDSSLWDSGQVAVGLENEVKELGATAERFQKSLPAMSKLRWSVVDKDKLETLINQLKDHNKSLYLLLPSNHVSQQNTNEGKRPAAPSFTIPQALPFRRDRMFCGRDDVIDTIHSILNGSVLSGVDGGARPMTRKTVVLYGLGGIGKSSIALEYSFRYTDSYTAVFWVDVTSAASMASSFRSILGHIIEAYTWQGFSVGEIVLMLALDGLLGQDGEMSSDATAEPRLAAAVRKWLAEKTNKNWLLIFDNYDDSGVDIHLLLPTCDAGNVIVTSRKSDLQMLGIPVPVEDIDEESGVSLLVKSANLQERMTEDRELAKQLAAKLGFLPLAITQAGSYISYTKIQLAKYMALMDESFRTLANKGGPEWLSDRRPGSSKRTILTTWEISFASLSASAQQLLLLCGSLANADIPDRLFEGRKLPFDWVSGAGDDWLLESRAELFRFSLAKRNASGDTFWIHPVVHLWARERLNTGQQRTKTQEALILLDGILKDDDKLAQDWAFERRIWSHLEMVRRNTERIATVSDMINDAVVFNALSKIGQTYSAHGLYNLAAQLLQWALTGMEKTLGKDHPSTLTTVHNMALVYDKQGEYDKALMGYQRALDGGEKTLGMVHPDTLATVCGMASVFDKQGEYDKALMWYQRALDGCEKMLGKDHPSTLSTVHNMASVFDKQGEYDKALMWYQRALDGYEKTLGKDHPDTLATVCGMASVFYKQGEYDKALMWYQRALDGEEKTLGKDHPSTLSTVHNMALVFDKQGEYDKALMWYQWALDGKEKTLGKDHPDTLATVCGMASVFNEQGEYDKALMWYQRALDGCEKTLGMYHPSNLATVNNMALVFMKQGEYAKALMWYQRALDGYEKTLGKGHPFTLTTVQNMASVFDRQGEYDKALMWYQRALDGREKSLGMDHPDTACTVRKLGALRSLAAGTLQEAS